MNLLDCVLKTTAKNNHGVYTSTIVFRNKKYTDENVFFTALIAYNLNSLKSTFTDKEQEKIDLIVKNCRASFLYYENKHGGITYNFYQTKPVHQYPGISFLNKFTALHIPDDLDSTSLIYLAKNGQSKALLFKLKSKLESLSYDGKPLKSIPKKYRQTKAYRTWFATKMKHDMDICVICNILTLVYEKKLCLSEIDTESIAFISQIIQEKKHLKQAYIFAPHYKTNTVVLYHIARLISISDSDKLNLLIPQISSELKELLNFCTHPIEKVILYTSFYKTGTVLPFKIIIYKKDLETFYWFNANPFSNASPFIKKLFSKNFFLNLLYTCPAYYYVLILELKQLSKASVVLTNDTITISNT